MNKVTTDVRCVEEYLVGSDSDSDSDSTYRIEASFD